MTERDQAIIRECMLGWRKSKERLLRCAQACQEAEMRYAKQLEPSTIAVILRVAVYGFCGAVSLVGILGWYAITYYGVR